MVDKFSKEEVKRRAMELARRVMSKPHEKQVWPRTGRNSAATNPGETQDETGIAEGKSSPDIPRSSKTKNS